MFDDIGKDSHRSSSLLSQISNNSYSPCSFQITQILMDRAKDVYATCRKNQGKSDPKIQDDRKSREETNQLINQRRFLNDLHHIRVVGAVVEPRADHRQPLADHVGADTDGEFVATFPHKGDASSAAGGVNAESFG